MKAEVYQADRRQEQTIAVVGMGLSAGAAIAVSGSGYGVWLLALVAVAVLIGPGICLVRFGGARLAESLMLGVGVNVALVMVVAQVCVMAHWWHPRLMVTALLVLGVIGDGMVWSGRLSLPGVISRSEAQMS